MAKKIVKVEDKKETKNNSSLDLGKLASVIMENQDAVGKIVDGIEDIVTNEKNKSNAKTSKKTSTKKSKETDSLSTVIDIAGTIFKK